ncbi:MAG: hypothetical protein ACR2RL_17370 [Gammaproteobacteria bacterium]
MSLSTLGAGDPELLKAWGNGDWTVARGTYFNSVLSEERNAVENWAAIPFGWPAFIAYDHGSTAPGVAYVVAESPGAKVDDRWYPRNSLVLVDELSSNVQDDVNVGLGGTIPVWAETQRELMDRSPLSLHTEHVADDANFGSHGHAGSSIASEFAHCGIHFHPAKKGTRVAGWETMRRLLQDARRQTRRARSLHRAPLRLLLAHGAQSRTRPAPARRRGLVWA